MKFYGTFISGQSCPRNAKQDKLHSPKFQFLSFCFPITLVTILEVPVVVFCSSLALSRHTIPTVYHVLQVVGNAQLCTSGFRTWGIETSTGARYWCPGVSHVWYIWYIVQTQFTVTLWFALIRRRLSIIFIEAMWNFKQWGFFLSDAVLYKMISVIL